MTATEPAVLLNVEDGVAILTLNRPQVLNAIDMEMAGALIAALDEVAARPGIRALVLEGAGRAFCAGGNVATFTGGEKPPGEVIRELAGAVHEGIRRMIALGLPTVAIVQGTAAGAGFSLMLGCDFVISADNARFTMAYAKLGATADGGASWLLPRLVGRRKALEILMLADLIAADEALRLGLVSRLSAPETLRADGLALARTLADGPTRAYAKIKALVDAAGGASYEAHLDAERDAFAEVAGGADFTEGVAAFMGKRKPAFRGA